MAQKPKTCELCPANPLGRSYIPFVGAEKAPVLFIGQGPGETEAALSVPFCGPSGQLLDKWCQLAGLDRRSVGRTGNVVQCLLTHPELNRPPKKAESDYCRRAHWEGEVAGRKVIVPIGVPAMAHFYPGKVSEKTAGCIAQHPSGAYVVGLLHPAFIMRGNWGVEGAQIQSLMRVRRILEGWKPIIYDFSQAPPGAILFPTLAEMQAWEAALAPDEPIVLDVENAGWVIRMIGLMGLHSLRYVGVHFRQPGGKPWVHADASGVDQFNSVVEWLYDLLRTRPIIAHNGFHDIEVLEETGFEVKELADDTILMAHVAMPESRKRLEFVSNVTAGISGWKGLLKEGNAHWK